jgi:hypothetical protein
LVLALRAIYCKEVAEKVKKHSQTQQISVALYGFVDVLLILFVGRHVSAPALGHHQVLS